MSNAERSDIANGIWLCRNCHKLIDTDPHGFPQELLFEWRRDHERSVSEKLGKTSAIRQRIADKRLIEFKECSYRAQQLIVDKPDLWEYKLTAELMRSSLEPLDKQWRSLKNGLYALPRVAIAKDNVVQWLSGRLDEASDQSQALTKLFNGEIQDAWGAPGEPGSEYEIHRVCVLIEQACRRLLEWEERVRFASIPDPFQEIQEILVGTCGPNMKKVCEVPNWLSSIADSEAEGTHELTLVFDLPDRWNDRIEEALDRARAEYQLG